MTMTMIMAITIGNYDDRDEYVYEYDNRNNT